MLDSSTFILTGIALICAEAAVTWDFCRNVQFDFTQPEQASADLKDCVEYDDELGNELHHRFLANWAKFASNSGAGAAISALENPEVRETLLPEEAWNSLMSRSVVKRVSRSSDASKPTFVVEISLVVVLAILTAIVTVWTLKLKSAVDRGLLTGTNTSSLKDRGRVWEPERERLLQECE